jgi:hypothetical protein
VKQEPLLQDAPPAGVTGARVARTLAGYRLPVSNEADMQRAIERAFSNDGMPHRREVTKGADRIDFVVGRVGVECKVDGSVAEVTRQIERYALWAELDELLLVTTKGQHLNLPRVLNGKPVRVHIVRGLF